MSNKIAVRPGWVIQDVSYARGGVSYNRKYLNEEVSDDDRLEADFETHKTVDNVTWVKELNAARNHVVTLLRKFCTNTSFGYFLAENNLPTFREAIERHAEAVEDLNRNAQRAGSCHRCFVGIVPVRVDVSTPETAREVARTVREGLQRVYDALKVGDIGVELTNAIAGIRNLHQLAVGVLETAVYGALEAISTAKTLGKKALRDGKPQEDVIKVCTPYLEPIEAAINLFTPTSLYNPSDNPLAAC